MNPTSDELNTTRERSGLRLEVIRSLLLCAILLVGGFAAGAFATRLNSESAANEPFADLEAVQDVIESDYYYYPADPEDKIQLESDMESGAIEGALGTLGDEYTRYLDVDDSQTAEESLEGKYGGVGIEVIIEGDVSFVNSVVPESPADDAGIVRGDVIEQINGQRVQSTDANEVLRLLRGDIGAELQITIVRPTTGEVIEQNLLLEEIVVPSVTLSFIEGTDYALIRISIFGDTTVADLDAAIAEIRARGSAGVILDLRGNGGGWVVAARQTIGRFVDPSAGPAMFEDTSSDDEGMTEMPIEVAEDVVPLDLPMVLLIDGGTASAAEIVAGAMKDYNRATIIGETSFGKGSVQRIYEFSDGSTMRVTVAEWFTPARARIQSEGIRPDIEVSASTQNSTSDPILEAGVEFLNTSSTDPVASPGSEAAATPGPA